MRRPCLTCGTLIESGSYCAAHKPVSPSGSRQARGSGGRMQTFRRRTLATTGGSCARCGSEDRVQAHHVIPVGLAPEQEVGVPLCHRCHREVESAKGKLRSV